MNTRKRIAMLMIACGLYLQFGGSIGGGSAPIAEAGFRVLIVYEDGDLHKMPSKQVQAMKSGAVLDYLEARCVVEGSRKAYRIWDQNISTANVGKIWQDAMALPRASLPWVIVSNGRTGFAGPLPADESSLLALLSKYGGK